MTLNLIGLGLSEKGLSIESLEACKKSDLIYLENYTVDFPYSINDLEKLIGKPIISLGREKVEGMIFLDEAKKKNISLLIYGSPLAATTHDVIIMECKKKKIPFRIFHSASVFTAIANSGLQLYKFGKTASMPTWKVSYRPTSFINILKDNQKISAHSLLLVDIGMEIADAISQLKESCEKENFKLEKIILCESLGTNKEKISYATLDKLPKKVNKPYCFIIPGKLDHVEEEFLKSI